MSTGKHATLLCAQAVKPLVSQLSVLEVTRLLSQSLSTLIVSWDATRNDTRLKLTSSTPVVECVCESNWDSEHTSHDAYADEDP